VASAGLVARTVSASASINRGRCDGIWWNGPLSTRRTRRGNHRPRGRPARPSVAARRPAEIPSAQDALIGPLREALRAPGPTQFWVASSPIIAILEEPGDLEEALPEGVDLLQSFIDVNIAETTAVLHMVAALSHDEQLRDRARGALPARRQPVPALITGLKGLQIGATEVFRDGVGDNHMVELLLPGRVRATLLAYARRRPYLHFWDALVVGKELGQVRERFARTLDAKGLDMEGAVVELDPAQSRTAINDALAGAAEKDVKQPEPGDQWPMLQPFVEFILSRMPDRETGYDGSTDM